MEWTVTFDPGDSIQEKLRKAANVKPSPAQLAWMEKEFIAFVHFGLNTFTGSQWGSGKEDIAVYKPTGLNAAQWCEVCARAGMKMIVLTAKHHDGFCLWHTETTDFSVKNSPVDEDVVESLRAGCEENGIELGIYLSPWDMHQREKGLWDTEEYNNYFLRQLEELLSGYGSVGEVWFDGACSDYEIWQPVPSYTPHKWYELIYRLQPSAVIRMYDPHDFAAQDVWEDIKNGKAKLEWSGKGVRWVGNEGGESREDEWSVQPVFDRTLAENATWRDLGQEKYYENAVGAIWHPLEVNTVVLNQWFWNEKTSLARSLQDLVEVYYNSVGNNGVLLLNVSPDTRGVINEAQAKRLTQLKTYIDNTFRCNLAQDAAVAASAEASGHPAGAITDGDKMTYWMPGDRWDIDGDSASLTIDLGCKKIFDNVMVQEYIREGQRVAEWSLEVWARGAWREVVRKKTIGYKNIKRFPAVTADKVRLNIIRSWDKPMICNFGLFLSDTLPKDDGPQTVPEIFLSPAKVPETRLQQGLRYSLYDRGMQSAALLDSLFGAKLIESGVAHEVSTAMAHTDINYSLSFEGYVYISAGGSYTFRLESADGSMLFLGDSLLINNDEPHEKKALTRSVKLDKGYYPLKVLYTSFRHPGELRLVIQGSAHETRESAAAEYRHNSQTQT